MRIVSWNMNLSFASGKHERAWRFLQALDPDVALLQEGFPPDWAREHWQIVSARKYPKSHKYFGSAIVTRQWGRLEELKPEDRPPGLGALWGAAVVAELVGDDRLWLMSVHSSEKPLTPDRLEGVPIDGIRRIDPTSILEIEVAAHDFAGLAAGRVFIAGGDLNSSLEFDDPGRDRNRRLFDNLAAGGFVDLRLGPEQRTFFREPSKKPYQLDHVYADATTAAAEHTWRVLPDVAEKLEISDHAPIEIEFPGYDTVPSKWEVAPLPSYTEEQIGRLWADLRTRDVTGVLVLLDLCAERDGWVLKSEAEGRARLETKRMTSQLSSLTRAAKTIVGTDEWPIRYLPAGGRSFYRMHPQIAEYWRRAAQ